MQGVLRCFFVARLVLAVAGMFIAKTDSSNTDDHHIGYTLPLPSFPGSEFYFNLPKLMLIHQLEFRNWLIGLWKIRRVPENWLWPSVVWTDGCGRLPLAEPHAGMSHPPRHLASSSSSPSPKLISTDHDLFHHRIIQPPESEERF